MVRATWIDCGSAHSTSRCQSKTLHENFIRPVDVMPRRETPVLSETLEFSASESAFTIELDVSDQYFAHDHSIDSI